MKIRGKKHLKGILILFVILALCPMLIGAAPSHTNEFYVNDFADVLSNETESYIFETALALDSKTTAQVCVLTVDSLEGKDISEYSVEVFREWGIGDKDADNGVLILLSVGDREMWVTTGYGIEGTLTDTRLGLLRDEYAMPYYSENDFDTGTKELFGAIVSYIMTEEYGLESLDGYENVKHIETEDTAGIVELSFIAIFMISAVVIPEIRYRYLLWYDKKHGTERAKAYKKRQRRHNNRHGGSGPFIGGGFGGGGGFSGGGGGFSGGGGSSGGGGAGGRF